MGKRLNLVQVRDVSEEERQTIKRLAHSRTALARTVERARVVHAALDGKPVEEIAVQLSLARATVSLWLHRFETKGPAGLEDAPRGDGQRPTRTSRWGRSSPPR